MANRHSLLTIAACAAFLNCFGASTLVRAQTADTTSSAIGPNANATNYSVSGGYSATSTFDSVAIGAYASANDSGGGNEAIGMLSTAKGGSFAGGFGAQALGTGSIALGGAASVSSGAAYGIAVGQGASVTGFQSVAIGSGSTDGGQSNVVSFGGAGGTRRLINVAPGEAGADAANMTQLNGVVSTLGGGAGFNSSGIFTAPVFTVPTTTGSASYTTVSAALAGIGARVTTLEETVSTSTGNNGGSISPPSNTGDSGGQTSTTQSANAYTDTQVSQLANTMNQALSQMGQAINTLSNRIDGVGAMSAANGSNLFNPADGRDTQLGIGVATYRGAFGYSVGMFHRISNNAVANLKISGATQAAGVAVGGGVTVGVNFF